MKTDEQIRIAKLDEQKRVEQEKASEKAKSAPAAVEARPESKPESKVESKPAAERPAETSEPNEQKAGKDEEKKD